MSNPGQFGPPTPPHLVDQAFALRAIGTSLDDVSKATGIPLNTIRSLVRRKKDQYRPKRAVERWPDFVVDEIQRLRTLGYSVPEIAKIVEMVPLSTVNSFVHHIPRSRTASTPSREDRRCDEAIPAAQHIDTSTHQ